MLIMIITTSKTDAFCVICFIWLLVYIVLMYKCSMMNSEFVGYRKPAVSISRLRSFGIILEPCFVMMISAIVCDKLRG